MDEFGKTDYVLKSINEFVFTKDDLEKLKRELFGNDLVTFVEFHALVDDSTFCLVVELIGHDSSSDSDEPKYDGKALLNFEPRFYFYQEFYDLADKLNKELGGLQIKN